MEVTLTTTSAPPQTNTTGFNSTLLSIPINQPKDIL